MDRVYSPKLAQQFLWESFMESGFEEGIELYSQHWDFLHADLGNASKHGADFAPWLMSCPLPPCSTSQRRAELAEEHTELWDAVALAPRAEQDQPVHFTVACSWLCLEDHQEPGPSFAGITCLKTSS